MTDQLLQLVYLVVGAMLGGALAWWPSYTRKKAENLATKQDALHEQQTRFARWHDRQAAILGGLYKRLARVEMAFRQLPTAVPDDDGLFEELLAAADRARRKWLAYFTENELYIDPEIATHVVELDRLITEAWVALKARSRQHARTRQLQRADVEALERAREAVFERIPELRNKIGVKMRKLLGGPPPPPTGR